MPPSRPCATVPTPPAPRPAPPPIKPVELAPFKIVLDTCKSLHILSNNRSEQAGHSGPPKHKGPDGAPTPTRPGDP